MGESENNILAYARDHSDKLEASAAKPGLVTSKATAIRAFWALSCKIQVFSLILAFSEAMLQQVLYGFSSDALPNDILKHIVTNIER